MTNIQPSFQPTPQFGAIGYLKGTQAFVDANKGKVLAQLGTEKTVREEWRNVKGQPGQIEHVIVTDDDFKNCYGVDSVAAHINLLSASPSVVHQQPFQYYARLKQAGGVDANDNPIIEQIQ